MCGRLFISFPLSRILHFSQALDFAILAVLEVSGQKPHIFLHYSSLKSNS